MIQIQSKTILCGHGGVSNPLLIEYFGQWKNWPYAHNAYNLEDGISVIKKYVAEHDQRSVFRSTLEIINDKLIMTINWEGGQ